MEVELDDLPSSQLAVPIYRWARHCSATWHFTVAKITQSDAFNYMSYHFLCKRGIRPARTEQFLVLVVGLHVSLTFLRATWAKTIDVIISRCRDRFLTLRLRGDERDLTCEGSSNQPPAQHIAPVPSSSPPTPSHLSFAKIFLLQEKQVDILRQRKIIPSVLIVRAH